VHIAELTPVALVKNNHHVLAVDGVVFELMDENGQLLDRRDDDSLGWITKISD
jgi:hypothetical protein